MNANLIVKALKNHKKELEAEFNIRQIGLFGSFARHEQHSKSDVDILVDFNEAPSLFKFIELKDRLHAIIGKPVDLVPKNALKHAIGKRILAEVKYA